MNRQSGADRIVAELPGVGGERDCAHTACYGIKVDHAFGRPKAESDARRLASRYLRGTQETVAVLAHPTVPVLTLPGLTCACFVGNPSMRFHALQCTTHEALLDGPTSPDDTYVPDNVPLTILVGLGHVIIAVAKDTRDEVAPIIGWRVVDAWDRLGWPSPESRQA